MNTVKKHNFLLSLENINLFVFFTTSWIKKYIVKTDKSTVTKTDIGYNLGKPFRLSYHLWRNRSDGKMQEIYLWKCFIFSKVIAH